MSGGVAFVLDKATVISASAATWRWSTSSPLAEPDDIELVRDLLIQHAGYTGSAVAARLLEGLEAVDQRSSSRSCRSIIVACSKSRERPHSADSASDLLQPVEVSRG